MALNFLITINPQFTQHIGLGTAPTATAWMEVLAGAGENAINANSTDSVTIRGTSVSGVGVVGLSTSNAGVAGQSSTLYGVRGVSTSESGVRGESVSGSGVRGICTTNYAGFFESGTGIGVRARTSSTTSSVYALEVISGIGSGAVTSSGHERHAVPNAPPSGLSYKFQGNGTLSTDVLFQVNNGSDLSAFEAYGSRRARFYAEIGVNGVGAVAGAGINVAGSTYGIYASGPNIGGVLAGGPSGGEFMSTTGIAATASGFTKGFKSLATLNSSASNFHFEALSNNLAGLMNGQGYTYMGAVSGNGTGLNDIFHTRIANGTNASADSVIAWELQNIDGTVGNRKIITMQANRKVIIHKNLALPGISVNADQPTLAAGSVYKATAAEILSNGDLILGVKA